MNEETKMRLKITLLCAVGLPAAAILSVIAVALLEHYIPYFWWGIVLILWFALCWAATGAKV
jgi:hypothetical protein